MKPAQTALPSPETLLASALFLMTNHARTRCPLVTSMIAQQLLHLARHPSQSVTPQLRAVCEKLAGQWTEARVMTSDMPAGQVSDLLH
jgi:hypothetical protein